MEIAIAATFCIIWCYLWGHLLDGILYRSIKEIEWKSLDNFDISSRIDYRGAYYSSGKGTWKNQE